MFVYGKYSPEHLSNVLSPAYDLLPVNVIMPEDTEEVALALNGKKTHIRKKIFFFAEECDISKASAEKMIEKIVSMKPKYIDMCNGSLLPDHLKDLHSLSNKGARCRGSQPHKL